MEKKTNALGYFAEHGTINKDDYPTERWENEIGPALMRLHQEGLVNAIYAEGHRLPVYAKLNKAGILEMSGH
ncbi:hypothetical protein [Dyadobacter frigoris]|uniref:Uncharacterized protein n=1 Tax=Dyadobacter frigoris TaxID=2576211 RepID=A0A4U6CNU0_9BACT|nr:hypothetical protein [Dyadobacter frigoris]TKT85245.1 hypothetical protein FDK13_34195 [Dyadobacter frigoris]